MREWIAPIRVGASVGVKGLRIGTGPSGHYIRAGRKSVRYRSSVKDHSRREMRQGVTLVCVLASAAWIVIAWNIFDPMSTIMFEPFKKVDVAYYEGINKLNDQFWSLMLGPISALWFLRWFIGEWIRRRR